MPAGPPSRNTLPSPCPILVQSSPQWWCTLMRCRRAASPTTPARLGPAAPLLRPPSAPVQQRHDLLLALASLLLAPAVCLTNSACRDGGRERGSAEGVPHAQGVTPFAPHCVGDAARGLPHAPARPSPLPTPWQYTNNAFPLACTDKNGKSERGWAVAAGCRLLRRGDWRSAPACTLVLSRACVSVPGSRTAALKAARCVAMASATAVHSFCIAVRAAQPPADCQPPRAHLVQRSRSCPRLASSFWTTATTTCAWGTAWVVVVVVVGWVGGWVGGWCVCGGGGGGGGHKCLLGGPEGRSFVVLRAAPGSPDGILCS